MQVLSKYFPNHHWLALKLIKLTQLCITTAAVRYTPQSGAHTARLFNHCQVLHAKGEKQGQRGSETHYSLGWHGPEPSFEAKDKLFDKYKIMNRFTTCGRPTKRTKIREVALLT